MNKLLKMPEVFSTMSTSFFKKITRRYYEQLSEIKILIKRKIPRGGENIIHQNYMRKYRNLNSHINTKNGIYN